MSQSIQYAFKEEKQVPLDPQPQFPASLLPSKPDDFIKQDKERMQNIESELLQMKLEMADVPTTDSLIKLYEVQAKGRAYYERSEEIYRGYLKYLSTVSLLAKKASFIMDQQISDATIWMRKNKPEEIKATKSGDERTALITSIIPKSLKEEKFQWETLEAQAKTNFTILRSYRDQFKSINDNVLIQLSIFKNLIMLGELKVDPEVMRAMRVIETSYKPTQKDIEEKQQFDSPVPELNIDEGTVTI